ncbi:hypothetical protein [Trueperella pyogenes]
MIIAPANQGDVFEGDGWKFDGNSITAPLSTPTGGRLQLQGLSPARKYRVNIAFNVGTGQSTGKTYLRVQGQIYNFPAGTYPALVYRSFDIDPTRPALIEFKGELGRGQFRISVTLELHLDGELEGPHRFALMAWLPRPQTASAKLGEARLGSLTFPDLKYTTEYFKLGVSRLGYGILREKPGLQWWRDITAPVTHITTWRGLHFNGFTGKGEIGTLTARIYNELEPRASQLIRGTDIILVDLVTRRRLFTGKIRKTITTPFKTGKYDVTIEAVDRIAELSAVDKYQSTSTDDRHWTAALEDILGDFPHAFQLSPGQTRPAIGSLATEASLTEYVDILSATAGVTWWADRDGVIRAIDTRGITPDRKIEFAAGRPMTSLTTVRVHDADATIDTEDLIATLEATNHTATKIEGDWQDTTTTLRATNETLAATYGRNKVTIDTAAYSTAQLELLLQEKIRDYTPRQVVKSVTVTPWKKTAAHFDPATLTAVSGVDLGELHAVSFRGDRADMTITSIRQNITPTSWTTTIGLS